MKCTYTYKGKVYSESEIIDLIKEGTIDRSVIEFDPPSRTLNFVDISQPLKELKDDSSNWTMVSKDSETMQYKGFKSAARVTAKVMGIINKMRVNPLEKESETYSSQAADSFWGNVDKNTALSTPLGVMNKEEYIQALEKEFSNIQARGTLLHLTFKKLSANTPEKIEEVQNEIDAFKLENDIPEHTYNWLTKEDRNGKTLAQKILSSRGINTFDDIEESKKDLLISELTIGSFDLIIKGLGLVGTPDLMVQHENGEVSIFDFKTGHAFNKEYSFEVFKYGSRPDKVIHNNHRNRAKLQLMWYMMIAKMEQPDLKFRRAEIIHIPSSKNALVVDPKAAIEIPSFLGMIESYLMNEHPDQYKALIAKHGKKLFQVREYMPDYEQTVQQELDKKQLNSEVQLKLDELREFVLFDLSKSTSATETITNRKKAAEIFDSLFKLINEYKIPKEQLIQMNDISYLTLWLGSNKDINSIWIQYYDKWLMEAKLKASSEINDKYINKFDKLYESIHADNMRFYGSSIFAQIPLFKYALNSSATSKYWSWAYITEKDASGNIIGKSLRHTDEHFKDLASDPKFAGLGKLKERQELMKFIVESYDSFFMGKQALANKVATKRHKFVSPEDGYDWVSMTNLDLANQVRTDNGNTPFVYKSGWFAKVPKLMQEYGGILNPLYRKELWNRSVKSHIEHQFEQIFNNVEALPFKYLGSDYIDNSENYSLNLEYGFKKFISVNTMKKYLDDVYALGKGMEYYLRYSSDFGVDKDKDMFKLSNTISYLETAIEMQVRGRKQMEFAGGFLNRNDYIPRIGQNIYRVDWLKVLGSLKSLASAPIMWLKFAPGAANGVFIYLYTLKEAIKNDVIRGSKFLGIDGDEFSFGVKDLLSATKDYFKMQFDAMTGNINNNKLFLLAKKFRYLPDSYDWGVPNDRLLSTRFRAISSSTMYMFHSVPEEFVALITMAAQLKRMKVSSSDKSVWDAYKVVSNPTQSASYSTVEWDNTLSRGFVKALDGSLIELKELDSKEIGRLHYVYQRLNGGYRSDERTRMEYFILGEMFLQFKKYLPNILRSGFASKHTNFAWGSYKLSEDSNSKEQIKEWHSNVMEGRWKVLSGLALNYMLLGKAGTRYDSQGNVRSKWLGLAANESYNWDQLSNFQREVVADFIVTFSFIGLLLAIKHFFVGGAGDSDEPKNKDYMSKLYDRIVSNFAQQWFVPATMEDILSPNVVPASWRWSYQFLTALSNTTFASGLYLSGIDNVAGFKPLTKDNDIRGWNQLQRNVPLLSSYRDFLRFTDSAGFTEDSKERVFIRP